MSYRLKPSEPVGSGVVRVIREEIASALEHASPRSGLSQAERVHKARTGCKKVRAALKLIRSRRPGLYRRENSRFRQAAHRLAPIRDIDTLPASLENLLRHYPKEARAQGADRVHRALQARRRTQVPKREAVELALGQFAREMRQAAAIFKKVKVPGKRLGKFERDLRRAYERGFCAFSDAYRENTPLAFHEWRKAVKNLGYHHRLLFCAWPKVMKGLGKDWGRLGDLLGEEHDLTVLTERLGELEGELDRAALRCVLALAEKRRRKLHEQEAVLGGRLFTLKPKVWLKRLEHGWKCAKAD